MEAVKRWSTRDVLLALQPAMPLWITDLHRGNLLDDPALAAQVREGSEREGSSTGMLFIETLQWRQEAGVTTLVLGAGQVPSVCELLGLRLRHDKPLELVSRERQWTFIPAAGDPANDVGSDSARWALEVAGLQAMAAVPAVRGVDSRTGGRRRWVRRKGRGGEDVPFWACGGGAGRMPGTRPAAAAGVARNAAISSGAWRTPRARRPATSSAA